MGTSSTPRILSIEDDSDTRLLLKHLLGEAYKLSFAHGAKEALSTIESRPFDLLLVDINLGEGKSGTDLLHMVRDREEIACIPAIALTAYSMPGDREGLLAEGFDGYVGKPFARRELVETIDQNLE